jgi:zinc transport system ATP-binding protein
VKALKVEHVTFAYEKTPVLEDVSFSLEEGDFLAVIGPNGGGKSTLMRLILGVLKPDSGRIEVFGTTPENARSRIGYVPQNTDINVHFPVTVEDVVLMGYRGKRPLWGHTPQERTCVRERLETVGVPAELASRRIGELSGGQRQRVMIARALCSDPHLLILDEPTANIDVKGQKAIYDLLKKLNDSMTVIVVTHDLSVILEYADKAAYVNKYLAFHDLSDKSSVFHTHGNEGHFCEVELLQMLGAQGCEKCNHDTKGDDEHA